MPAKAWDGALPSSSTTLSAKQDEIPTQGRQLSGYLGVSALCLLDPKQTAGFENMGMGSVGVWGDTRGPLGTWGLIMIVFKICLLLVRIVSMSNISMP